MRKPLRFRGKILFGLKKQFGRVKLINKRQFLLFVGVIALIPSVTFGINGVKTRNYAHASVGAHADIVKVNSPLFENQDKLFAEANVQDIKAIEASLGQPEQDTKNNQSGSDAKPDAQPLEKVAKLDSPIFADGSKDDGDKSKSDQQIKIPGIELAKQSSQEKDDSSKLAEKLYEIVGDAPIKEMVPFISERDEKVAAFLVGIAKKESSFGFASPSKGGQTCYNYWGYKGSGGRGTGMGYACFASAEEAIQVVGDRIETLVGKERNTPARMVDTWKCGRSCAGDPGAPGWVSTVALYFNQIVNHNS